LAIGLIEGADGLSQRFVLMAGIGLDGEVVRGVRASEKRLLKKGAYLLSGLRCLFRWPRERFTVTADGRSLACHSVIVCNCARYGGNRVLTPGTDISEPMLDLFCITGDSRSSYLRIIAVVMSGRPCRAGDVTLLRAGQVEVGGVREIQLDGDYFGQAPVRGSTIALFARIIT
jgi:diacylglycerol kinase family enzyme